MQTLNSVPAETFTWRLRKVEGGASLDQPNTPMNLIGLTGGIGMGKSTAAKFLRAMQLPVVDTDEIARLVVEPGQPALDEIKRAFGPELVGPDGRLRRQALADLVFRDGTRRKELESILHPRIRSTWLQAAALWRAEGRAIGVVVIPLLFETGAEVHFDAMICIACSRAQQLERLQGRGWKSDEIERRTNAQQTVTKKIAGSTYVVWSEGSLAIHRAQLQRIIASQST